MGDAFTPGLLVSASGSIQRLRELPIRGEILVAVGDQVSASDVVAKAELEGDLFVLRVAERMGIEPFEVIAGMRVRERDTVQAGDLICQHSGLFGLLKSEFRAPDGGFIEFVSESTGHLGLRTKSKAITLSAYISGKVVQVEAGKSLTIETEASLVQGVFGVGGERRGKLATLATEREVGPADLPADCEDLVLVAPYRANASALMLAAERGAKGFIAGSIDDRTLAEYLGFDVGLAITGDEKISMTVIITEGFGSLTMAERTHKLFGLLNGRECSINGATQVRAGAIRPEIIVPGSDLAILERKLGNTAGVRGGLVLGGRVKVIRVPFFGQLGEIVELPQAAQALPTGAKARVARVRMMDGKIVTIPRANLELA